MSEAMMPAIDMGSGTAKPEGLPATAAVDPQAAMRRQMLIQMLMNGQNGNPVARQGMAGINLAQMATAPAQGGAKTY